MVADDSVVAPNSRARIFRELALSAGAFVGLVCVLFALAAVFFGITPLIFRSGSMSPAIDTGALALSKKTPADDIQIGDIVNVTNAGGSSITHRVVDIGAVGTGSVQLFLKGDANADPDVESYIVSDARRVFFSVDKLGYAVAWLSGPIAVFLGGIAVGALLMLAWRPRGERSAGNRPSEASETPPGRHSRSPLPVILAIACVGAVAITASNTPTTLAAGTDTATATSGSFTTGLIPAPGPLGCTNKTRSLLGIGLLPYVTLSWATAGAGYTYRLTLTKSGSADIVIPISTTAATGNITHDVENGAILNLAPLTGTYTARVQAVSGTRLSAPSATFTIDFSAVIVLLPSAVCGVAGSAGVAARSAPAAAATTTESLPPVASTTTVPPTTTTTVPPTTTATVPPTTTSTVPLTTTTTTVPAPPPLPPTTTSTTTTSPSPAPVSTPTTSPSGASTARVVDLDGSPTLQIVDTAGTVQYSAPATSSEAYGYGVNWSAGDQLWLLGPNQLVRLDASGGSWSRTVVDPAATDEIPAEILALLQ
ncbi:signal peptidase I [Rhodococcoides fascians]|uniref:signal peptidase I n=1 Tax=Rhodococcoides fascians TaxID=1828 RepID=UPI000B9A8D1B|nr:signal peptidase I [Rhodococcus fascians]OZE88483.1 signal peptidase I [Rhodococcus fascians]OZF16444.1 signal peptidase I [Rhodococcus fascians]OZF19461.1 signal peptidase I [Rhodococcus fascians]OZF65725.1 signal peptidase I [Rhodococcus fascians]OZF68876.1 signal peptidase I [Rhodococcus fascians]